MEQISVTVVGLGQMGSVLVPPLLRRGVTVTVWNRSPEKAAPLVDQGAVLAPTLVEAIEASDLAIICLASYEISAELFQTEEVLRALRGKTVLQLTTGSADDAEDASRWIQAADVSYLEGAIMDYPNAVGTERCMLLASGPRDLYDRYAETLRALGGGFTYVGSAITAANTLDGGLLTIYYASAFGFMQSAAMMMKAGISPQTLNLALDKFRPVIDKTFTYCTDQISRQDYTGSEASIQVHTIGVQSLLDRTKAAGLEHGLLQIFADYLIQTGDRGFNDCELPAAFEVFRPS